MARLMYDSIDPNAIPASAEMVAGYVDGRFVWDDAGWARFPNATKVRIAVFPWTNDGDVLDVESGDATPQQAPGWLLMRQAAGVHRPTIYCNRSNRAAIEAACAGITYDLWVSTLDGTQNVPGAVAVQYAGSALTGHNYDLSTVTDDTWLGDEFMGLNIDQVNLAAQATVATDAAKDPAGRPIDDHWTVAYVWQYVQEIQAAVNKLQQPAVDATAVASALGQDQAFLSAIAAAVAKEISKDLANG
jgi:hypothetical protein